MNKGRLLAAAAAIATGIFASSGASAQAVTPDAAEGAQQTGVPTIVVTATRREESLQDVPIAVTAFGDETIEALSAETVGALAEFTPNLTRTAGPTGGNDAFFFIRGIGQVDSNPAADPGVGVYVDGVYYARLQGASIDTDDIARVEVLRGPQGTLFGRNTIGGAINITTEDPGRDFGVQGRVTVGMRERFDAYAAVDLPASDALRFRVSGSFRTQEGWGENVYTGETFNDVENLSGRVRALWEPDPDMRLALTAQGTRGRGTSAHTILVGFNPAAGPIPGTTPLGVPFPPLLEDTSDDIDDNFSSIDPRNDLDTWGVSGDFDWGFSDTTSLRVIVAYRQLEQFVNNDFDGTAFRTFDNIFDTDTEQLSGEVHLYGDAFDDRLQWLVGGYAFEENINHTNAICLGSNLGAPGLNERFTEPCLRNNQRFQLDIQSLAAFANASFEIVPSFSIILGGRFTSEEKEQRFDFFLDNAGGVFSFFGIPPLVLPTLSPDNPNLNIPTTYNETFEEFTPRIGLEYEPASNLLVYANYARGFKSGGFNGRPSPNPTGGFNEILPYEPETLETYELGLKSDLLNDRLRFNAAAFFSNYDGIQLLVLDPDTGFFNTQNAGENEIYGFEIESLARPVEALTLYANVGYVHDEYTFVNPLAVGIDLTDDLPVTPTWNVSAGGNYEFLLSGGSAINVRADYSYRSSVFYGAGNAPLEFQEGVSLLNLRASWTSADDRFRAAVYGTNVTDERYFTNAQDVRGALGVAFANVSPPAEFGVEFGFEF
jgi:iron complex outermembrane receptor protein